MRKLILYILLGLPGLSLMAQQTISSDSVYFYSQTSRQAEWAHNSATQLLFRDFNNIARSQLYASRAEGGFRRAQETYRQTTAGFQTDGIKTFGRFTMAGTFNFEKRWDDSAAWWNSGEFNEAQPYYFFAGKAGAFEKQVYDLSATAAYNLWKNIVYAGISGNYRYYWTTRSVDPRPNAKEFKTRFRPEVSVRLNNHIAGIGVIWGRGSENNSVGFKNSMYNGNVTYIERNNFMSLGFGNMGIMGRHMQRYNETGGFFANYAASFNNWRLQATGGYELWQEDIALDSNSTRSMHNLYAFLQKERSNGDLLITHEGARGRQQWELNFTTQSMLNWSSEFNATSYQYTASEANITYRQLWEKGNGFGIELGGGCNYINRFKEDIAASHRHQLQVITPHVYAGIYRRAANKSSLSFHLTPSFTHTLTNELVVPATQENYFTRGIAYTDYLYWQKNSWGIASQFNFIQKGNSKRHRLGCTVNMKWQQVTDGSQTDLPALYLPSGSRWSASASLNLYL